MLPDRPLPLQVKNVNLTASLAHQATLNNLRTEASLMSNLRHPNSERDGGRGGGKGGVGLLLSRWQGSVLHTRSPGQSVQRFPGPAGAPA